jgi:hypothetical protein
MATLQRRSNRYAEHPAAVTTFMRTRGARISSQPCYRVSLAAIGTYRSARPAQLFEVQEHLVFASPFRHLPTQKLLNIAAFYHADPTSKCQISQCLQRLWSVTTATKS